MKRILQLIIVIAAVQGLSACTYGPNSSVTRDYNYSYPPVGYVLTPQPAPTTKECRSAVYQTFWTYDQQGRFNPTQQYVCLAPSTK